MVGGSGGGSKVVATLTPDGTVYATEGLLLGQLAANLMNYKIRTESEMQKPQNQAATHSATIVDLGKQLLQFARDNDVKGVKTMLQRGAPFSSDWLGMCPLHFAAMNNQYDMCSFLLRGGINKDSKTKVDRTPLHLACYYGNERIVELLLEKNCAINCRDILNMTPLHWAVEKKHKSIVRLLLRHSADVTIVSKFGRTAMALAVLTEQADLMQELEAAKQAQANRKNTVDHEKETNEAVNSIMNLNGDDAMEEGETLRQAGQDVDSEDDGLNPSDFTEVHIRDLGGLKGDGALNDNAINLLKSHGIAMMPDDEEDTSKEMLNTALQNGRQLVLSEGGRMLLNESKKITHKTALPTNNNNNNKSNFLNNNNRKIVPIRFRAKENSLHKISNEAITKAKDATSGVVKNKNIRIISLNDFKKLYGNTHLRSTTQKMPPSLANSHVVRQLPEDTIVDTSERKVFVNVRQVQSTQAVVKTESADIIDEEDISNIIQTDSEHENESDSEMPPAKVVAPTAGAAATPPTAAHPLAPKTTPVRFIPAKRVEHMGTVQVRHLPTMKQLQNPLRSTLPAATTTAATAATATATPTTTASTEAKAQPVPVVPLLNSAEICRQLYDLRRQNVELRRKFEVAQREKDEMRQRLDRLEEMLLVEKAEEDYVEP